MSLKGSKSLEIYSNSITRAAPPSISKQHLHLGQSLKEKFGWRVLSHPTSRFSLSIHESYCTRAKCFFLCCGRTVQYSMRCKYKIFPTLIILNKIGTVLSINRHEDTCVRHSSSQNTVQNEDLLTIHPCSLMIIRISHFFQTNRTITT